MADVFRRTQSFGERGPSDGHRLSGEHRRHGVDAPPAPQKQPQKQLTDQTAHVPGAA
jgi:hypothetical protein